MGPHRCDRGGATTRTRGPGALHDRRRAEILAAVQAVAGAHGISAVSQASVATAAGVSPGRVQHYFPTKDALLEATFAELNAASSARIAELLGGDPDHAPPRCVLETVLTQLVPHDNASRAHLQFRQAYTALALHHDGIAERLRDRYRHLHEHDLATLIDHDRRAGSIPPGPPAATLAARLAALAEGLAYYVLIGVLDADHAQRQILDDVAALYGEHAGPGGRAHAGTSP